MVNYKVIKRLKEFERPNGESVQLNIMKWHNNPEKYDLRKWDSSGNPQKGVTISEEELYQIYIVLKSIFEKEQNEKIKVIKKIEEKNDLPFGDSLMAQVNSKYGVEASFNVEELFNDAYWTKPVVTNELPFELDIEEYIEYTDVLIHTNSFYEDHIEHSISKKPIHAMVSCLDSVCAIRKHAIEVNYCFGCKNYYIDEKTYKDFTKDKIILAEVFNEKEFEDFENCTGHLREKSMLRALGYDTSRTDNQRKTLIDYMIHTGVRTKGQIRYHLEFLIEEGLRVNHLQAVKKWKQDLEYLRKEYY